MSTNGPSEHLATLRRMLQNAQYNRLVWSGILRDSPPHRRDLNERAFADADASVDALSWVINQCALRAEGEGEK